MVMQKTEEAMHAEKLCLVDVGGAGGLQDKWMRVADKIVPVIFEPNPEEAAKLREKLSTTFRSASVVEKGLAEQEGPRTLHLAKYWGCTSMLTPNQEILSRYRIAGAFTQISDVEVDCTTYKRLYDAGVVPRPDVIKIDVQGYELSVLNGFGDLLETCLGIELEAHFYPIYQKQALFGEIVSYLDRYGFVLRATRPSPNFDRDIVEIDACFTKHRLRWDAMDEPERAKMDVICDVWGLTKYSLVNPRKPHWVFE